MADVKTASTNDAGRAAEKVDRIVLMVERAPYRDNLGMGSREEVVSEAASALQAFVDYADAVAETDRRYDDLRDSLSDDARAAVQAADRAQRRAHNHVLDTCYALNRMFGAAGMAPLVDLPSQRGRSASVLVPSGSGREPLWRRDGRRAIKALSVAMGRVVAGRGGPAAVVARARYVGSEFDPGDLPGDRAGLSAVLKRVSSLEREIMDAPTGLDPAAITTTSPSLEIEVAVSRRRRRLREQGL